MFSHPAFKKFFYELPGSCRLIFKLLGVMEVCKKKFSKLLMTTSSKFRVGNMGILATFLLAPDFQISVIALATLWAPSVQK